MTNSTDLSLDGARTAAERGELGPWMARFLSSPGSDNAALAEDLSERVRHWTGPLRLPIGRLHRLKGPPDEPVLCPVDEEEWPERVDDMEHRIEDGWEPPPVIVVYRNNQLVLEDGNHRVESLRRAGEREAWAIVGFESEDARERFDLARV